MSENQFNILMTIDENYIPQAKVMLLSLKEQHPEHRISLYLLYSSISEGSMQSLNQFCDKLVISLHKIEVDRSLFQDFPITDRYPLEMYYRIFAASLLPKSCDRILYLDPDTLIIGKIDELYNEDLEGICYIACTHVQKFLTVVNGTRIAAKNKAPYINTGVLLINVELMREMQEPKDVEDFIKKHRALLFLPDQDIISALYGDKIHLADMTKYNLSDRMIAMHPHLFSYDMEEIQKIVRSHTSILHFCGRNKPWKKGYKGFLKVFYDEAAQKAAALEETINKNLPN